MVSGSARMHVLSSTPSFHVFCLVHLTQVIIQVIIDVYDPTTIYLIVLGLSCVGPFLLLCFLPREVPLAFVLKLVWWC